MAKIKFGMMMTDARGKLGGQVFSKNRGGSYIRTKVTPSNPQSTAQSLVRQTFSQISQSWSGLTSEQIAAFNGAVSGWAKTDIFGDLRNPTGKNLFTRLNQNLTLASYPQITTPPEKLEMVSGVITAAEMSLGSETITLTGAYSGADATLVVNATPILSPGKSYVKNLLRNIYHSLGSTLDTSDLYDAYTSKFGTPTAGDNIFIGVKYVLPTGQSSPVQTIKLSVVA